MAAAQAIDNNFTEFLGEGIKNLLRYRDSESEKILRVIIDARTSRIIFSLLQETQFREMLLKLLTSSKIQHELKEFYAKLFEEKDFQESARRIRQSKSREVGKKICAVDDSGIVVKLYQSFIHELEYRSVVFKFPLEALNWIKMEKPALVFTDLNMPEITGIELIKQIRSWYSQEQLPIIMVTAQNDDFDRDQAARAGANEILGKPFAKEDLEQVIRRFFKRACFFYS